MLHSCCVIHKAFAECFSFKTFNMFTFSEEFYYARVLQLFKKRLLETMNNVRIYML
jgi:hypothetical protein